MEEQKKKYVKPKFETEETFTESSLMSSPAATNCTTHRIQYVGYCSSYVGNLTN